MDAWGSFAAVLFLFPPFAILFVASVVKLLVLLNEKTMSWGRAFLIGLAFNVVALIVYFNFFHDGPY